jgi:cytochrome c553
MRHAPSLITASVLALIAFSAHAAGNAEAGKQKSQVCQSCHGPDGNSASTQFPRLAGQYPDYLVQALSEYKSGARKNPIMAGFAANLSERDMQDIAAYFAEQKNGVYTKR